MTERYDPLDLFACPRCGATVEERFWGPCQSCRLELVAAHQGEQSGETETARFEPAMHVVPNHVATKD
jgi:hypothetical protein